MIRTDGANGFRIELQNKENGSATLIDQNGVERYNIQIHIGAGCSEGCTLLQGGQAGRDLFESTITNMLIEDFSNDMGIDEEIETDEFEEMDLDDIAS